MKPQVKRDVEELALLFEVSQTLDDSVDLQDALGPVLDVVARHTEMVRGALALLNRDSGEIKIDAAHNLSTAQVDRGRYQLGEGVTGRVVETGQPVMVRRIGDDDRFLNRTKTRGGDDDNLSFVCVPIRLENTVIGALSADLAPRDNGDLNDDVRLFSIVASMIAQSVRLRQRAFEERAELMAENTRLQNELSSRFQPDNIVGRANAMQFVYDMIAQVAPSSSTVLIRGESGTGKELIAHAIHYNSNRRAKPFIKVNCAALPENVIESELFGHERGAFTGAVNMRKGRFELAHGGTLFLDEIGDLSASTQVKLLRVLQEKEFERVGGVQTIKTDVRVLAATNRDLEESIEAGEFRQDLYYRLNVFPIHVPPLRERRTDIILLADHFVDKYNRSHGRDVRRISTPAIDMLMAYHWPGNVRELENCIERAVLLSQDDVIHGHHLPPSLQTSEASGTLHQGTLQGTLDSVERELIIDALKSTRGNMAGAARQLGITERQMGLRVKKHEIDFRRFRTKT